jgi:hypothetical protein
MKILLILGDYWHAPGPLEYGLKGALKGLEADFTTVIDPSDLDLDNLTRFDLIILSKEGMTPREKEKNGYLPKAKMPLAAYVEMGGKLMGFHGEIAPIVMTVL